MSILGENINYKIELLKAEDHTALQHFKCNNEVLDNHIRNHVIENGSIVDEDGLYFKIQDTFNNKIVAVVSLATSGILLQISNYSHMLPAVKIDIFAVDNTYQKLHYDSDSENAESPDDHYYLSDDILCKIISKINEISEKHALVDYVVVFADRSALRYYFRNKFLQFEDFMCAEHNMEINENIPLYLPLNN